MNGGRHTKVGAAARRSTTPAEEQEILFSSSLHLHHCGFSSRNLVLTLEIPSHVSTCQGSNRFQQSSPTDGSRVRILLRVTCNLTVPIYGVIDDLDRTEPFLRNHESNFIHRRAKGGGQSFGALSFDSNPETVKGRLREERRNKRVERPRTMICLLVRTQRYDHAKRKMGIE